MGTLWGYMTYFNLYVSNSRGVAILFNNNCKKEIQKIKMTLEIILSSMSGLTLFSFLITRNTVSNAHKMIPPLPHVLYGKVLVLLWDIPKSCG